MGRIRSPQKRMWSTRTSARTCSPAAIFLWWKAIGRFVPRAASAPKCTAGPTERRVLRQRLGNVNPARGWNVMRLRLQTHSTGSDGAYWSLRRLNAATARKAGRHDPLRCLVLPRKKVGATTKPRSFALRGFLVFSLRGGGTPAGRRPWRDSAGWRRASPRLARPRTTNTQTSRGVPHDHSLVGGGRRRIPCSGGVGSVFRVDRPDDHLTRAGDLLADGSGNPEQAHIAGAGDLGADAFRRRHHRHIT